jgi:hypothetical protein
MISLTSLSKPLDGHIENYQVFFERHLKQATTWKSIKNKAYLTYVSIKVILISNQYLLQINLNTLE